MTERPAGPGGLYAHDTAGVPFRGRTLTHTGFPGDEGGADEDLANALTDLGAEEALVAAFAAARVLAPVVAVADDVDMSGEHAVEKSTDMAAVTLVAADGQRALPVFTSLASLSDWDPTARPVAISAVHAARAAMSESCDVMVLDVAGPVTWVARPSVVRALARGRSWRPALDDPVVRDSLAAAVGAESEVVGFELRAVEPRGTLGVRLGLQPGLGSEAVHGIITRISARLADDDEFRTRVDGLALVVVKGG